MPYTGRLWFAGLLIAAMCQTAGAANIYVDASAPPGGNGKSWNKAFHNLHHGLYAAKRGDVVRVAQGVYTPAGPNGNRDRSFVIRNGVKVQGGYAGRSRAKPNKLDPSRFITRLSGDLNGDDIAGSFENHVENSIHVVRMKNVTRATHLRGLVISGGFADSDNPNSHKSMGGGVMCVGSAKPTIFKCTFEDNFAAWFGAGLRSNSAPLVKSSVFRRNHTGFANGMGAGAWVRRGVLQNCVFIDNFAGVASTGGGGAYGQKLRVVGCTFQGNGSGGVLCSDGSLIRNCLFVENGAEDGGGVMVSDGQVAIIDCDFIQNGAASFGGAVFARQPATVDIINCSFKGNNAFDGAAILNRGSMAVINSVFSGNHMFFMGSASTIGNLGAMQVINCTIANNANAAPGAAIDNSGTLTLDNSILWANASDGVVAEWSQVRSVSGTISLSHNLISGWSGEIDGINCFAADPQFIDAAGPDGEFGTADDNLRIAGASPCRNAGDMTLLPADTHDVDRNGNTSETMPVDHDGNPRVVEGQVDLGAHEVQ